MYAVLATVSTVKGHRFELCMCIRRINYTHLFVLNIDARYVIIIVIRQTKTIIGYESCTYYSITRRASWERSSRGVLYVLNDF